MDDLELLTDYSDYLRKKKEEGKKIVAFMAHDNVPEELIDAVGFVPLRMIFAGNDNLMNESQSLNYLPASTCSFAQTCIGLFSLKPNVYKFLDMVDYFIVSNHCISDICTSEIITKYFFIPRLNCYSSYTQSENALKYFKLELLDFKKQLEIVSGKEISNEKIIESIKKYNLLKSKLVEVNDLIINGKEKLKIFQKAILYGPDSLSELENIIEKYKNQGSQKNHNSKDLLFTGCSIFIGDYLIDLIEDGGGNIVFFDTWIGWNYFSQYIEDIDINSNKEPLDLLVLRFKNNIYGDHTIPNFLENKIAYIKQYIDDYKQETGKKLGVINHIIKFCDHISIFQSILKKKLQEKEIQVLNLERDYSKATRGQLSTRIEAFLEMM